MKGGQEADHPSFSLLSHLTTAPDGLVGDVKAVISLTVSKSEELSRDDMKEMLTKAAKRVEFCESRRWTTIGTKQP